MGSPWPLCAFDACADNALYDSLAGLSDREAPQEQSIAAVASQLVPPLKEQQQP